MLAYRHAFHAGNHADVLKHLVLVGVLRHMNLKDKGYRVVDTHAGAGGYSLDSPYAHRKCEFDDGIGRLWKRTDLPALVADYVDQVRQFNAGPELRQYPGSPAIARQMMRPQDDLRLFELHPTDYRILSSYVDGDAGVQASMADGFASLKSCLPPPTRRAVLLIDPSYELKADYAKVLAAMREALTRFATGTVMVWLPQLQLLEAAQLPARLKASAATAAPKGWLHARLTVARADTRGFGMLGSSVFVCNPPHSLAETLRRELPWLSTALAQEGVEAAWSVESGGDHG
jgi:23S rRNA (adenine2030-N6)-methyltransferase